MAENLDEVLGDFGDICPDPPERRPTCEKCRRPANVCWCPYLPSEPIAVSTTVYLLQHPFEETRTMQTGRMLLNGLAPGKCHILQAKRFSFKKFPVLEELVKNPRTLLMFPGPDAQDLTEFVKSQESLNKDSESFFMPYNLVLIDGTWPQAKGIFHQHKFLQNIKQVQLSDTGLSEYVIRTQPDDKSLSTLETAAIGLSILEGRPDVKEALVRPMRALCDFQIEHGAVRHQSRQYRIENGLYFSPQKQKNMKECGTKS